MDLNRFEACAAAYGAERRRWPQREHALYDRFAGAPEGEAILAAAQRTDGFLDALEPAAADARLADRIAARARPAWRRLARPAAALAASAVLGFAVGFAQARSAVDADVMSPMFLGPQTLTEIGL